MAEANDSVGWMSGLISNSSATSSAPQGNQHSLGSAHVNEDSLGTTKGVGGGPSDVKDQAQRSELSGPEVNAEMNFFVEQVTQLVNTISLTPKPIGTSRTSEGLAHPQPEGKSQRDGLFPIFFSAVPAATSAFVQSDSAHSTSFSRDSSVRHEEEMLEEKIQRMLSKHMLTEVQRSSPDDKTDLCTPSPEGVGDGHRSETARVRFKLDRDTLTEPWDASAQVDRSSNTDSKRRSSEETIRHQSFERDDLLHQKCEAQQLLISKLYKDVLASEERQSRAEGLLAELNQKYANDKRGWETERLEWAAECTRLARLVQTAPRETHNADVDGLDNKTKRASRNTEMTTKISLHTGYDGSRRTFVSMHEELHYTRGYNTALRDELERLKAELSQKDKALREMAVQLRNAYLTRAGLSTDNVRHPVQLSLVNALDSRRLIWKDTVGAEGRRCCACGSQAFTASCSCTGRMSPLHHDTRGYVCVRKTPRRRSTSCPRRRSTSSPFRNTHL